MAGQVNCIPAYPMSFNVDMKKLEYRHKKSNPISEHNEESILMYPLQKENKVRLS